MTICLLHRLLYIFTSQVSDLLSSLSTLGLTLPSKDWSELSCFSYENEWKLIHACWKIMLFVRCLRYWKGWCYLSKIHFREFELRLRHLKSDSFLDAIWLHALKSQGTSFKSAKGELRVYKLDTHRFSYWGTLHIITRNAKTLQINTIL